MDELLVFLLVIDPGGFVLFDEDLFEAFPDGPERIDLDNSGITFLFCQNWVLNALVKWL